MNDITAAIGLAQLKKLDYMNRRRAEILKKYLEGIKDCKNIKPAFPYDLTTTYYDFMLRIKNKKREEFIINMQEKGISTGVHTMPLTLHPLYKNYSADISMALRIWDEYVILPFYVDLSDEEIQYVIDAIISFDKQQNN